MEVTLLLDAHATIGEAPTWIGAEQAIYWIDVKAPALHRMDFRTRECRSWRLPADVGAFALTWDHTAAIVALRTGVFHLDLATEALERLAPPPFDPNLHRFNEGACDSQGRFWVGTMFDPLAEPSPPPELAGLYSFTLAGGLRPEPDAAELHNGMAWSPDESTFYLSHSHRHIVLAFPFDAAVGRLGPSRPFVSTPAALGVPDGAAVDAEGGYWCALHGGSRLHRYRPDGTLNQVVELPVSQPTMCAFVGQELELMVVTSASDKLSPQQLAAEPHAGSLFCLKPDVPGLPRHYTVA